MDIKLGRYVIKSDAYCYWIVEQYTGKSKSGKEKTQERRVTGYFKKIEQLLEDFTERKVRNSEAKEVKELLEELSRWRRETAEEFKAILEPINK